jgi:glutamate synthase domain-containing protein 2
MNRTNRRCPQGLSTQDAKFACRERAALLSQLYMFMEAAVARALAAALFAPGAVQAAALPADDRPPPLNLLP